MCGEGREVPSKHVRSDDCLEEVAADLQFEGWIEYEENEGYPSCMGVC